MIAARLIDGIEMPEVVFDDKGQGNFGSVTFFWNSAAVFICDFPCSEINDAPAEPSAADPFSFMSEARLAGFRVKDRFRTMAVLLAFDP